MFLDDKLLKMVMDSDLDTKEEIQHVYADICTECEKHYKDRINQNSSNKQLKSALDRVFNSWDSFIRIGEKINDVSKVMFIDVLKKNSFKKQFLADDKLRKIYESLQP